MALLVFDDPNRPVNFIAGLQMNRLMGLSSRRRRSMGGRSTRAGISVGGGMQEMRRRLMHSAYDGVIKPTDMWWVERRAPPHRVAQLEIRARRMGIEDVDDEALDAAFRDEYLVPPSEYGMFDQAWL